MPTEELFGNYHFLLEVSGITADQKTIVGGFKGMSGMDSETEVIEFKQGNDKVVRKKPGRTTYANITLERGFTATDDLWLWRKNIEDGIIDRRAGTITMLDQDLDTIVAQYNFYEGWPCKWFVPELDSDQSGMAIEKIEIAVEKIERVMK
ncbi:MAG: phage tail protein [Proteobacteria bacterium]|jgi:phage tail-like protein|nr:phage tail protein [Pseudomonadota bacterium]